MRVWLLLKRKGRREDVVVGVSRGGDGDRVREIGAGLEE